MQHFIIMPLVKGIVTTTVVIHIILFAYITHKLLTSTVTYTTIIIHSMSGINIGILGSVFVEHLARLLFKLLVLRNAYSNLLAYTLNPLTLPGKRMIFILWWESYIGKIIQSLTIIKQPPPPQGVWYNYRGELICTILICADGSR